MQRLKKYTPTYPALKKLIWRYFSQPFQDEEVLKRARDKHWNNLNTELSLNSFGKCCFQTEGNIKFLKEKIPGKTN